MQNECTTAIASPRVAWLLTAGEDTAASRYHGYLPAQFLRANSDIQTRIVFSPQKFTPDIPWQGFSRLLRDLINNADIVVFQKISGIAAVLLMRALQRHGKKVVFFECDYRRFYPFAQYVTAFIAPSERIVERLSLDYCKPAFLIPDPIEFWHERTSPRPPLHEGRKIQFVWIGAQQNFHQLESFVSGLNQTVLNQIRITSISDHKRADIRWSRSLFPSIFDNFDAALLPVTQDRWSSMKSPNRATLFMSAGLPLCVQKSDIYLNVAVDKVNALVFQSSDDFEKLLPILRDDLTRDAIIAEAYETAQRYQLPNICDRWLEVIYEICRL
jgi:hypothetical protein